MDDKRLQTEFDEYFKGAALPENITADAKSHVKPRKRDIGKWILLLAPIAAAFVLIVTASVAFLNRTPINNGATDNTRYSYYTAAGLDEKHIAPYSAKDIKGLEFVQSLAYKPDANINLTALYESENMVLAKAEISLLHDGYRHDAVMYAEYTDEYYCFEELKDYHTGDKLYYRGYDYIYNLTYDEGESVYMIYLYTGGVKYYFSVMTSEPDGYKIYLDLLKNN